MKFFVFLTLIGLCVYQFASIQAASAQNSRQKRLAYEQNCPKDANTAEACIAYAKRFSGPCGEVTSDGETYNYRGCGTITCENKNGEKVKGTYDHSKSYPQCCPRCPEGF